MRVWDPNTVSFEELFYPLILGRQFQTISIFLSNPLEKTA